MEDLHLVQFQLDDGDGEPIYIEVMQSEGSGIQRASSASGRKYSKAIMTFDEAVSRVTPVVSKVAQRLKHGLTTPADEVEVRFGLKFTADLGGVVGSVGSEANFEITLKWKGDRAQAAQA